MATTNKLTRESSRCRTAEAVGAAAVCVATEDAEVKLAKSSLSRATEEVALGNESEEETDSVVAVVTRTDSVGRAEDVVTVDGSLA